MKLGSPYFSKKAEQATQQEAPRGLFDMLAQAGAGGSQLTSAANIGQQGLTSLLGEVGGGVGALGMLGLQGFAPGLAERLNQPIALGYGDGDEELHQKFQIASSLQAQQLAGLGESGQRVLGRAAQFMKSKGIPGADALAAAAAASPQTAAMVLQGVVAKFPEVGQALAGIDPSFIADYTPFVQATLNVNNNRFDPQVMNNLLGQFKTDYSQGRYAGIPANTAAQAYAYATEKMGAEADPRAVQNLARAGDAFLKADLAPDFASAMVLADSAGVDAARSPVQAIRYAQYMQNSIQKGFANKEHIQRAAQVAKEQGIPFTWAMHSIARGSGAGRRFGKQHGEGVTNYYASLAKDPRMATLASAYEVNKNYRAAIDNAIRSGDARQLSNIINRASRDRTVLGHMNNADTPGLLNRISLSSPRLAEALMADTIGSQIKRVDPSVASMFRKDRKGLLRRIKERDFTGLNSQQIRSINQLSPAIMAADSVDPSVVRNPSRVRKAPVGYKDMLGIQDEKKVPTLSGILGLEPTPSLGKPIGAKSG